MIAADGLCDQKSRHRARRRALGETGNVLGPVGDAGGLYRYGLHRRSRYRMKEMQNEQRWMPGYFRMDWSPKMPVDWLTGMVELSSIRSGVS